MKEFKDEYKEIDSAVIISDQEYQRRLNPQRVRRIVAEWNENIANPPKVSLRDGNYYVFDGQHTLRARVLRNNGKDLPILCRVFYGMTQEDEAALFAEQTGVSARISKLEDLVARYKARDVDVLEYKEAIENDCDLVCDFEKSNGGNRRVICHAALYNIYIKHGKNYMVDLLEIINGAWDSEAASLRREIICGLDTFMQMYTNEYSRQKLIKNLSTISPMAIVREGKEDKYAKGNKRFAKVIYGIYNKGQKQANRLQNKF